MLSVILGAKEVQGDSHLSAHPVKMVVPPDEQPRIPTPEVGAGINEGGDEVLVSIRAGALLEGRRHGDRAAQGTQPNGPEPPNGRRQDLIVPRPPQSDGRERHVSREISLEGEGEVVYRPMERWANQIDSREDWVRKIDAKMEELIWWKELGDHPIEPKITITPPFTPGIMSEPLPPNFKPPNVRRFDGTGDPQEHVLTYQAAMMLMGRPRQPCAEPSSPR
nr:serine/arginine repetitive matrix protein 1-like [Ipomoea batatas]